MCFSDCYRVYKTVTAVRGNDTLTGLTEELIENGPQSENAYLRAGSFQLWEDWTKTLETCHRTCCIKCALTPPRQLLRECADADIKCFQSVREEILRNEDLSKNAVHRAQLALNKCTLFNCCFCSDLRKKRVWSFTKASNNVLCVESDLHLL